MSINRIYRGIFGGAESWDDLFFNQRLKLRVGRFVRIDPRLLREVGDLNMSY